MRHKYDKAINAIEYEITKMDICLMGVGSEGFKDRCLKEKTELQQAINLLQSDVIASGVVEYNKKDDLYVVGNDFSFIIYDDDRGERYNGQNISIHITKGEK